MPNSPTTTSARPWRLLVLVRDADDAAWLLATVVSPADVRPAGPDTAADDATAAWVAAATGLHHPVLTPLPGAAVWRVNQDL